MIHRFYFISLFLVLFLSTLPFQISSRAGSNIIQFDGNHTYFHQEYLTFGEITSKPSKIVAKFTVDSMVFAVNFEITSKQPVSWYIIMAIIIPSIVLFGIIVITEVTQQNDEIISKKSEGATYIFAYGSLMLSSSRNRTAGLKNSIGYPVIISKMKRGWIYDTSLHNDPNYPCYTALGVELTNNHYDNVNGTLFKLLPDDLLLFDKREKLYIRKQVSLDNITFYNNKTIKLNKNDIIYTYVVPNNIKLTNKTCNNKIFLQSYLDICLSGAIETNGIQFAYDFINTTYGWKWNFNFINDRKNRKFKCNFNYEILQLIDQIMKPVYVN